MSSGSNWKNSHTRDSLEGRRLSPYFLPKKVPSFLSVCCSMTFFAKVLRYVAKYVSLYHLCTKACPHIFKRLKKPSPYFISKWHSLQS
ncbi:hypothetical protein K1T44_1580 [Listeria innocua]|nr:hypothetical protein K1T44_1580 [Listeria innocua]